jgi:thiol-disulfide isomerase/thioredoxin
MISRVLGVVGACVLVCATRAQQGDAPAAPAEGPAKAAAAAEPLMVGDKAPGLKIEAWVKGEPVTGLEKGKVYVVEFWATWCMPCRASMPHLTELEAKYKERGVAIIGVASGAFNDSLEKVKPFVEQMGDKIDYRIGWDDAEARQEGIPTAFVVSEEGRIAWIGNPLFPEGKMDGVIDALVEKKFDMEGAVAGAKRDAANAKKADELLREIQSLWEADKKREAMEKLDEVVALDGEKFGDLAVQKFGALLVELKDSEAGYAYAKKLEEGIFKDNAAMLNSLAWVILTAQGVKNRDAAAATRMALRANELSQGKNPGVLDTLARAYFESGEVKKAVETQTKAVELATTDEMKAALRESLVKYERAGEVK